MTNTLKIHGGRVLTHGEDWSSIALTIAEGKISFSQQETAAININAEGLMVLPGIIDLHGDAFERQIMPRPGVQFGHQSALIETDNQMIANGITTAYHGLTYSWEPGLRGAEAARKFVNALGEVREHLRVDTRFHLRHETYNLPAEDEIIEWMQTGKVDLLAFNDHMEHIEKQVHNPNKLSVYAGRTGLTKEAFYALHQQIKGAAEDVPESIKRIAAVAREHCIPMASHDDETPESRQWYEQLGCRICEFPVDMTTATYAKDNNDPVIMGAPNVMRGGSHCGRLSAVESIRAGVCNILTSDYYYPTLPLAAFKLANDNVVSLSEAWNLISKNPAEAVDKIDRGILADGKRADVLLVDASNPALPIVKATIIDGKLQYTHGLGDRLGASKV